MFEKQEDGGERRRGGVGVGGGLGRGEEEKGWQEGGGRLTST